jgi:hypothetical protein
MTTPVPFGPILLSPGKLGMEIAERSPLLKQKGHGGYRAPFFLVDNVYPTVAGTGSSTLASRRNFAASSGGVGLI